MELLAKVLSKIAELPESTVLSSDYDHLGLLVNPTIELVDISDNDFKLIHDIFNDNIAKKPYTPDSISLPDFLVNLQVLNRENAFDYKYQLDRGKEVIKIRNKRFKRH